METGGSDIYCPLSCSYTFKSRLAFKRDNTLMCFTVIFARVFLLFRVSV